jgi:hypothetical protein
MLALMIPITPQISVYAENDNWITADSEIKSSNNIENFTIIILPDTQFYSKLYPEIFNSQTRWIVDNIESLNIVFVAHLGDIVDDWKSIEEWNNANKSLSILDDNVAWSVLLGNHDGIGIDDNNYEIYFGSDRFRDYNWYGGGYQNLGKSNYQLFSAGGDDYLVLNIQYDPNDDVLSWANDVIEQHPNRRIIVSTHEYIAWGWFRWHSSIGERIYENLVKKHADKIFLVISGHIDAVKSKTQEINGYAVHEMVLNYQAKSNGGNGWLRILEFSPSQNKIFVRTFSPFLNKFEINSESEYTLDYNMNNVGNLHGGLIVRGIALEIYSWWIILPLVLSALLVGIIYRKKVKKKFLLKLKEGLFLP